MNEHMGEFFADQPGESEELERGSFYQTLRSEVDNLVHIRRHAHELMIEKAQGIERATDGFFTALTLEEIEKNNYQSVEDYPYAKPNLEDSSELETVLNLMPFLLGEEQSKVVTQYFADFTHNNNIFERIREGQKFVFIGNHGKYQDVGYHVGGMHLASRELTQHGDIESFDRLENHLNAFLGKSLGFSKVLDMNVMDDVLLKACGIFKVFPVSGSDAHSEEVFTRDDMSAGLKIYRKLTNRQSKKEFYHQMESAPGQATFIAGAAEPDIIDARRNVVMPEIDESTRKMAAKAAELGAYIIPIYTDYSSSDAEQSYVRFGEIMDASVIKSEKDVHVVGENIAAEAMDVRLEFDEIDPKLSGTFKYNP